MGPGLSGLRILLPRAPGPGGQEAQAQGEAPWQRGAERDRKGQRGTERDGEVRFPTVSSHGGPQGCMVSSSPGSRPQLTARFPRPHTREQKRRTWHPAPPDPRITPTGTHSGSFSQYSCLKRHLLPPFPFFPLLPHLVLSPALGQDAGSSAMASAHLEAPRAPKGLSPCQGQHQEHRLPASTEMLAPRGQNPREPSVL